jgi:hypothetical protein
MEMYPAETGGMVDYQKINILSNLKPKFCNSRYNEKTYAELSNEFRELYPTALYAFQLIPRMYNTLTLVEKFSHKAALKRLINDHKDLPGFSKRNIHRYLPLDNACVPRRVRTPRPKSSKTESNDGTKLSGTKSFSPTEQFVKDNTYVLEEENQCPICIDFLKENQELKYALQANSGFKPADTLLGNEREYCVPKEMEYVLTDALEKSERVCFIIFDCTGKFLHAEADTDRMTCHATNNGNK